MNRGTGPSNPTDTPALDVPLPYGLPLTLKQAKAILHAAEAEAERKHWPVAIVIADASGDVVLALKRDQTQHTSRIRQIHRLGDRTPGPGRQKRGHPARLNPA